MLKGLKKEILAMLITGAMYLFIQSLEVKTPGIKKVTLILEMVFLIVFGMSVVALMINSGKKEQR